MGKITHIAQSGVTQGQWGAEATHLIGGVADLQIVRSHMIIVATSSASASLKAQADYALTGTNDEVTLLTAINALPEFGGASAVGTKTGSLRVIGNGSISLGALLDFPPLQNADIDLGQDNISGAGIRLDSTMNVHIRLGVLSAATGGVTLDCYPRTAGPDNLILFGANKLFIGSLVATSTNGLKLNSTNGVVSNNTFLIDEGPTTATYTTPFNIADGDVLLNRIIVQSPIAVHLRNSADQTIPTDTSTAITFNTENYDTYTMHEGVTNPSRITCIVPGFYLFGGTVAWAANATSSREISIRLNGSTVLAEQRTLNLGALYTILTVSGSYWLNSDDYIELVGMQRSGGDLASLNLTIGEPSFWAMKMD